MTMPGECMTDDLLSVKNLSKRFEKQTVIENLTFCIPKGERVTIFGPSGAWNNGRAFRGACQAPGRGSGS